MRRLLQHPRFVDVNYVKRLSLDPALRAMVGGGATDPTGALWVKFGG